MKIKYFSDSYRDPNRVFEAWEAGVQWTERWKFVEGEEADLWGVQGLVQGVQWTPVWCPWP